MASTTRAQLVFILLSSLVILSLCFQVEAQFFTKSSSKSIPRMGRRSEEPRPISSPLRRIIIDNLIDTYGPNLLEALVRKDQLSAKNREQPSGELFYNNEQPMDMVSYEPATGAMSRDERSTQKEASLAMRALNINRYMQHLASGQPLMSYDKLIGLNNNGQTNQSFD